MNADLFGNPLPSAEVNAPSPKGLLDDGLVRTTGWLQFGARPVSSGVVSALICLPHGVVVALALWSTRPVTALVVLVLLPLVGGGAWLLVNRLLPASRARNVEVLATRDLAVGRSVRLYGSIGVVGRINSIRAVSEDAVEVRFAGGARQTWAPDYQVQIVELLD